jgi:hypothetical protein
LINEQYAETINQFREFFTQKILTDSILSLPKEDLMFKDIPLHDSRQPINRKGDIGNYWMNTPLKKNKQ